MRCRIYLIFIMFIKKLPYIIYREFSWGGYLTDNRNFGYDTATCSCIKVGDLIISKEGCIFYSLLKNISQSLNDIVCKVMSIFIDVPYEVLLKDAQDFYSKLAKKGFIYVDELNVEANAFGYFSYAQTKPYLIDIEAEIESVPVSLVAANSYFLSRVHIDVSSRCNENCVHCYIPKVNKCDLMTEEMFDKILAQCVSMRVLNITLSGGEPMLNPNLNSFLLKCQRANFSINILSNLTLLSEELLEIIIANPLIGIQTSLYAMDEDVHDAITCQKGSFQRTLEAIKRLHRYNVPMQINCPIMKQNFHYYREVLDFAASYNIEASSDYTLFGCYDSSKNNLGCRVEMNDVETILHFKYQNEHLFKEDIGAIEQKKTDDEDSICSICKSSLCVSNKGDVYPCEGLQRMVLGNLSSLTLKQIWEELPLTKHLRELKYRDFQKCYVCSNRKYCTTCLVMNTNEHRNDYMVVNPYMCELTGIKQNIIEYLSLGMKNN